ncbi:MAG: UDP-N-acetylmuramoyl-tripeptide--D-alanyl-D-alanine ligase [Gammaproteobacteria bacterium]|nr:UDP-N-acetylmuramoyl-tripeptide--D-alanyl-D-alanine ligase [Gammaproteobacteria bacterium]
MRRTLCDFAAACGGRLVGADRTYAGVSTDTRTIGPGELFIALRGPRFNGNEFLAAAQAAGAVGAVVDGEQALSIAQIVVPDTQVALARAAQAWRRDFPHPVIGVAGSNGKTTVKEMIAAILSQGGPCLATRGNLNNHIGVPLTLLRLEPEHRFAVIEMGANRAGDVAGLVAIARPDVGLITNAGAEHLEGFGSLEGVARAEGEMVAGLEPAAVAVINADDPFAPLWRQMTRASVLSFGLAVDADFRAADLHSEVTARGFVTRFMLVSPAGRIAIELALAGRHNVANALAAAAAASAAGATPAQLAAGLATMRAVPGRLQLKLAQAGAWIIDDSYNANPSSVQAGLEVLVGLGGRRWLVLGDMAELGSFAESSHAEVGRAARAGGVERLLATGPLAALAAEAFGSGGEWYPDVQALTRALEISLAPDVRVLVKGSRVNRLERLVEALTVTTPERGVC